MNDEQELLASAYLDGEVTAEERRIAESDPEVMAEVERMRALQARISSVPMPSDAARESAVHAAMAEFRFATPATPPRTRPATSRYLAIAAATVAVAALGVIVSQAGRGGDDDDAATADVATAFEATAEEALETEAAAEASDTADAAAAADEMPAAESEEGSAEMATMGAEATSEASTERTKEESAEEAGGGSDVSSTPPQRWVVGPDFDPTAPITDERELGVYGVHLLDERDTGRLPPSPNTRCTGDDEILGVADLLVDGTTSDGTTSEVYIGVIEMDGTVVARDTATCDVVLVGSLFAS